MNARTPTQKPSDDHSFAWIESFSRQVGKIPSIPLAFLGIGLCSAWLGWMLGFLRDMGTGFDSSFYNPKICFDYGEIMGALLCSLLISRLRTLCTRRPIVLSSAALMILGSIFFVVIKYSEGVFPDIVVCSISFFSGLGYFVFFLLWLELHSFISPMKTMLSFSFSYIVSSIFWFLMQDMSATAELTLALLLPVFSLLLLVFGLKSLKETIEPRRHAKTKLRSLKIMIWIWLFAFAYGVGGSFTQMSYSTAAAKIGTFVAAAVIVIGIILMPSKTDFSVFYRLTFVFMAFGFIVSLFLTSDTSLMQICLSISNCLVTILTVTFACGLAYLKKTSALRMIAPMYTGWFIAALAGKFLIKAVTDLWNIPIAIELIVVSLLIVFLFIAALFWFREIDFLAYWRKIASDTDNTAGDKLAYASKKLSETGGLSKREESILALLIADKSQSDIAQELFIAPGTVRAHTNHIYTKLDVHSREELLALLEDAG